MIKNTDNSPTGLAIAALNGFKWLGNNLHNIKADPDLFAKFYTSALEDAEKALAALDVPPKPAWTMPVAPAGPGWHRNDFTEADLPPVTDGGLPWRPLLKGERKAKGTQVRSRDNQRWQTYGADCDWHSGDENGMWFFRTRRPLPSAPKLRAWTFEEAPMPVKVKRKTDGRFAYAALSPEGYTIWWNNSEWADCSFERLLSDFIQLDGQPCGVTE